MRFSLVLMALLWSLSSMGIDFPFRTNGLPTLVQFMEINAEQRSCHLSSLPFDHFIETEYACPDFWGYACDFQESGENLIDPRDEVLSLRREYEGLRQAYIRENNLLVPYLSKLTEAGHTTLTLDFEASTAAYHSFFAQSGQTEIVEKLQQDLIQRPFVNLDRARIRDVFSNYLEEIYYTHLNPRPDMPAHQYYRSVMPTQDLDAPNDSERSNQVIELLVQHLTPLELDNFITDLLLAYDSQMNHEIDIQLEQDESYARSVEDHFYPRAMKQRIDGAFLTIAQAAPQVFPNLSEAPGLSGVHIAYPSTFVSQTNFHLIDFVSNLDAGHDDVHNYITVLGGGRNLTDEELNLMMAHEYGHAIEDLATRGSQLETNINRVRICLQTADSIGGNDHTSSEDIADFLGLEIFAQTLANSALNQHEKQAYLMNSITACDSNQTSGSTRRSASGMTALFGGGSGLDLHSSYQDRMNRILMANPVIREILGCSSTSNPVYCGPLERVNNE